MNMLENEVLEREIERMTRLKEKEELMNQNSEDFKENMEIHPEERRVSRPYGEIRGSGQTREKIQSDLEKKRLLKEKSTLYYLNYRYPIFTRKR